MSSSSEKRPGAGAKSMRSAVSAAGAGRVPLIGITGGIGSGKSTVSRILRELGCSVFDCDAESRRLQKKGSPALDRIRGEFGDEVFCRDGRLNRRRLARAAFADPERTEALNRIMHGAILEGMKAFYSRHSGKGRPVFAEIPLLFEVSWQEHVDRIWLVTADTELRVRRAAARGAAGEDEVRARIARQLPDSVKIPLADTVLLNEGTEEELRSQVEAALNKEERERVL